MEGDGRQAKKSRREEAPAAAAGSGGGGGGGGDWGSILPPGLLSSVMAFLPFHLLIQLQLPPLTWQLAARKQHHLTISAADEDERSFWQAETTTTDLVTEWATYLRQVTSITLRCPTCFPRWCLDVFVAMIEGHVAGRRAANIQDGTLKTITIREGAQLTIKERQIVARTDPPLPDLLDPPPLLDALTTIEYLTSGHQGMADRGWVMPSLTVLRQRGWDPDRLGRFISSSGSLQHVDGAFRGDEWARLFGHIPQAPAGQQVGPLAKLERIGFIRPDEHREGIDRLQAVLVARGCRRSLKLLHVQFDFFYEIGRPTLPLLLALNGLVTTCCRPNVRLSFYATDPTFGRSLFHHVDFPTRPSPSVKTMIQQLAQQATSVGYIFTQDDLTDNLDSPSQAAIDTAKTLSFDKAETVEVKNAAGFHPPANTPSPHPTIIDHLKPFQNVFQRAPTLSVRSNLGGAAARLLADKMPEKVREVDIREVSGGEEMVGVLRALGRGREVREVLMRSVVFDQLDQQLGQAAGRLPTIESLYFKLTLPDDVEDVGSLVRARLSSAIPHVKGLQRVDLLFPDHVPAKQLASIETSLPDGGSIEGFAILYVSRVWLGLNATRNP
ncbi:unnamed protein product [Vitrella brassicaformis CCMP3155]|uniref:Uncharacterized protein n=1 Tax=Vitrella brassicaformis (strain CCMP3155) TaxID=1169540 RepID=A0A0G4EUR6_VITBC|nr:unnamed protein product [Vitrella brassicaformis CCMP3155]|eukprot:CEM01988.1 unnamed protein product [Vitrella brassicaformis CCMP3155]